MTSYYNGFPQSDRDEAIDMINLDELEERAKEGCLLLHCFRF